MTDGNRHTDRHMTDAQAAAAQPLQPASVQTAAAQGREPMHHLPEFVFTGIVLAVLLLPLVGMAWAPTVETTENRTLAPAPSLTNEDGSLNVDVLGQTGTYFEDHFAYRNQLVSANARLNAALGTSATDQVVVGKNGWLYYAGTLPDYLGQTHLSDRALRNIAHNLRLLQRFTESRGAQFVFAVAPNKNTLYAENMPNRYLKTPEAGNWERLMPILDEYQVNYVDLSGALDSSDEVLYFARDTHWTNEGALLGGNVLLEALGHAPVAVEEDAWETRDDYVGDIAKMLYPFAPDTEPAAYAAGYNDGEGLTGDLWEWAEGASVEDDFSTTHALTGGNGTLVMFRDSFANALIPYYATAFSSATFTKLVPYDAATISIQEADHVIVERAERHLDYLAQNAPIMPAPALRLKVDIPADDTPNAVGTTLQIAQDGNYTVFSGELGEGLRSERARIYVALPQDDGTERIYEASTVSARLEDTTEGEAAEESTPSALASISSDYGFVMYLPGTADFTGKAVRVICVSEDGTVDALTFPQ